MQNTTTILRVTISTTNCTSVPTPDHTIRVHITQIKIKDSVRPTPPSNSHPYPDTNQEPFLPGPTIATPSSKTPIQIHLGPTLFINSRPFPHSSHFPKKEPGGKLKLKKNHL